jgi:hypothetical protein
MRFQCSECSFEFQVSFVRLLFARPFRGRDPVPTQTAYYLKCPNCGKKSWLTAIHATKVQNVSEEKRLLVKLSFRSMLLIDVSVSAVSLLMGVLLVDVLALSNVFRQFYVVSGIFFLHALFSITLYIHKEVKQSIRFLNNLMLISATSAVVNLILMYFRVLLS